MFKIDKETTNYIVSLPHDKMPNRSPENLILCENELLLTSEDKLKPNTIKSSFLYHTIC